MRGDFRGGLNLKFFTEENFESLAGIVAANHRPLISRNALRLLLMGWSASWSDFLSFSVLKAIFIKRDPELLRELRLAFQLGFETIFSQLHGKEFTESEDEQIQIYLSNCLCLLPYADLTPYECIRIPQKIAGQWTLVEYYIKPIELTELKGINRYLFEDNDRVFAYGLEALHEPQAQSHLIFMGTTYPAGQGFVPQVNTDFHGFKTVGHALYKSGRQRLLEWLELQNNKPHVCGVSLGGSLSLLLAIEHGDKIERVDAWNPAGLHNPWYKSRYDLWDELTEKPRVVVQQQGNDWVSSFGIWKKGWEIFKVNPPQITRGPLSLCDHFMNGAGFAQTEFVSVDPVADNNQRRVRNFLLYSVGRSLVYYLGIAPYTFFIRPLLFFAYKHWHALALGVAATSVIGGLIGLALLNLIPAAITIIDLLVLAITLGGGFLALAVWRACFDGPPATNEVKEDMRVARLHHPALPRNQSLDIYKLEIDIECTNEEWANYRKIMWLIKDKQLPTADGEPAYVTSVKTSITALEQLPDQELKVTLTTTRARARYIKTVLSFIDRLGLDNEDALRQAALQEYARYKLGKHPKVMQ